MSDSQQAMIEPQRVLVADDERLIRRDFIKCAQQAFPDCAVNDAIDFEDVKKVALTFKPDLVLLDVMMPGERGADVIDAMNFLRDMEKKLKYKITILVVSGVGAGGFNIDGFMPLADGVLKKPVHTYQELVEAIRAAIKTRQNRA